MNRRLQIFLVGILFYFSATAQNQTANWYFGLKAGINFNTNPPSVLNNGSLLSTEGSASISTAAGDLLFYTNGQVIWGKDHKPILNGEGLLGNSSATQSAIVVPKPKSKNIYYVFTLDHLGAFNGLRYSEVDISLNSGKGAVTSNKNISLKFSLTEKLTAIRHGNGEDYWVLVHGNNENQFFCYRVTSSGVSTKPVISSIGSTHTNVLGYMKFSPNGKKVACAVGGGDNFVEVLDFDDLTGKLSNPLKLSYSQSPYGVEFSPNSELLYVSAGSAILQYTIPQINSSTLLDLSKREIKSDAQIWGLQLGQDGKIYVCKQANKLSVINNPNDNSGSENFLDNIFSLSNSAVQGLPNFPQHYFNDNLIFAENTCVSKEVSFRVLLNEPDSIHWNFGDNTTSNLLHPKHVYSISGNFEVTATVFTSGYSKRISRTITIEKLPSFSLGNDTTLCKGQYLNYKFNFADAKYLWNNGSTTPLRKITTPGTHFVDITINGCTTRDSVTVAYTFVNPDFEINKASQCLIDNNFEFTSKTKNATENTWYINNVVIDNKPTTKTTFTNTGIYKIKLDSKIPSGCKDTIVKEVVVNNTPIASFNVKAINTCGTSNSFVFEVNTPPSPKNTTEFIIDGTTIKNKRTVNWKFSQAGKHKVVLKIITEEGCEAVEEKTVTVYPALNADFIITTNSQCLVDNSFSIRFSNELRAFETLSWQIDGVGVIAGEFFSKSFTTIGKHEITAILENTSGCKEVITKTVEVFDNPKADFSTPDDSYTCLGQKGIKFNNLSTDKLPIISYQWDFGDNSSSSLKNPTKDYSSQSSFIVSLSVENEAGCIDKVSKNIKTYEQPDISINTKTISACENNNAFEVSYTNSNSLAAISKITWQSSNGSAIPSQNPAPISFASKGDYTLDLNVETIYGCKANASTTVTVTPAPTGSILLDNAEQCIGNNIFSATVPTQHNGINIRNVVWDLSTANNSGTKHVASFSYDKVGDYDISATVTDDNGCEATFNSKVIVHPNPKFSILKTKGCVNEPVTLNIDGLSPFIVVNNWSWDLGNSSQSSALSPKVSYNQARKYNLRATATSDKGCSYTSVLNNGVEIFPNPVTDFEYRRISWNFEETVLEFQASSSINTDDFVWNFGNGKTSTSSYERVDFTEPGYYQVSLTAKTENGCEGTIKKTILIVPPFDAYVPTSFTPNGDGKNDYFGMEGVEFVGSFKMYVFNRWGQKIHTSTSIDKQWDGRFNGKPMPPGMYTYSIAITDAEGRPYEINGTIQLIR